MPPPFFAILPHCVVVVVVVVVFVVFVVVVVVVVVVVREQSVASRYVHGLSWALSQMTGMGMDTPNARTAWEKVFTMTVNVIGFTL